MNKGYQRILEFVVYEKKDDELIKIVTQPICLMHVK